MRKLLAYGTIKNGVKTMITSEGITTTIIGSKKADSPRRDLMVPVIIKGQIIGYQYPFGPDTSIYTFNKEDK